eukprot:CAMPEP_0183307184 /NCGR_PEP_ID=MMETSP0160_2-20130417/16819_1 /TAXON_ID=2839 ORGANISM="Odontella Sinensis, Strain Grunow 1884" /NCGR_SAMPLE_ID=MMETSP0160_2 /ASSEMBLY_ACC=CAM_ASM_000250 /LENGTH=73 /DNA_ID=CAMNT_0025470729 /DNA_START=63 /DNA_END=284 /DNA_ORIENTATION=+
MARFSTLTLLLISLFLTLALMPTGSDAFFFPVARADDEEEDDDEYDEEEDIDGDDDDEEYDEEYDEEEEEGEL